MTTTPEFIPVGALGEEFASDSNALEENAGLGGSSLTLRFPGDRVHECTVSGDSTVAWDGREAQARVTSIRAGVYLLDFLVGGAVKESLSLVLDTAGGQATLVAGYLPNAEEASVAALEKARAGSDLTGVRVEILHGTIDGLAGGVPHGPTKDLLGLRNRYRYSPHEVYEHIYLNQDFYTWHCLQGAESGLADTDRCHYIKIADGLYLFVWREKIVPTLGVILIDMERLKTDGKILGYRGFDFDDYVNFRVGAVVDVLNETRH
ncbi:MoaF C-terminal domain-containing protein [Sinomonas sp. G460-2]|uniref:MoaF C-terminal domain-containing protein n=1 Tax=Sinomonas sp. G460-2 TaxID=3393464 RepID=UPI0039EE65A3